MTERQTVAGAYEKIASHEDICAVRYKGINDTLGELKGLIHWILGGVASVGLGLIAWMALQLYALNDSRLTALERPSTQTVVVQQPRGR